MLDRELRVLVQPLDEVLLQPGRAVGRERRDDDLVYALVVDRLHGGGVGIRMCNLAVRFDPFRAEDREGTTKAALRLRMVRIAGVALRADDQEARGRAGGPFADPSEQRVAEHGLVREDENVRLTRALV